MPTAYEGNKPYIFVSYSHKDKAIVMRCIEALERRGFRIWFDGGIEAGSEWPEYIANHLAGCSCILAFISANFADSKNCRRELALAQDLEKEQLNVYIEQVELPLGLRMQLGLNQAIWLDNFKDENSFFEELGKAKLLLLCKETVAAPTAEPPKPQPVEPEPAPPPEREPEPAPAAAPQPEAEQPPKYTFVEDSEPAPTLVPSPAAPVPATQGIRTWCKILGWVGSILELSYIPIGLFFMLLLTVVDLSGFWVFVLMIIPHTLIALINKLLFKPLRNRMERKNMDKSPRNSASASVFFFFIIASGLTMLLGGFALDIDANFFVRLLASIGLNTLPCISAGLITLFLAD